MRVEWSPAKMLMLGLVDGVLVAVDRGDFTPVFFEVEFGADAYPVLSHGVFEVVVCAARVQNTIAVRVFAVWGAL